ncbi:MAG: diguanylate cyclase [Thermodesulfobacteriota bacterium]
MFGYRICAILWVIVFVLFLPVEILSADHDQQSNLQRALRDNLQNVSDNNRFSIAILNNFPPFSFEVKGRVMGFTVDYIQLLEKKTGIRFQIEDGTWKENLRRFQNGHVDMITAMSYTEDRTAFTRFTDPYYIIPTVVYTREGSFAYSGVQDLFGRKVGIESGVFYKQYLQKYPQVKIKEIEDTNDLMRQLSFGQIDAVITNINIGNYMLKKHVLDNVKLAGRIDIPSIQDEDLRIGVRRELGALHSLVQDGINQVSPREYKALQDRWVGFSPSDMLQGNMLPAELALLNTYKQEHGGLRLGSNGKWYPVDFLDSQQEHQGIAADIFSLVREKQNIPFVLKTEGSFQDSLAAVQSGRIDVLPAVVPNTSLRKELAFTKPYLSLPLVIATRNKEIFINDLQDIPKNQVSYVRRHALKSILAAKYSHLTFQKVGSAKDGLQRVQEGQDFAFIGTLPAVTYAIQKHSLYNIKISGTLDEKLPVAAAVDKDNKRLLHILQKGLNSVSLQEREDAVDNWISIRLEEKVDYTLIWSVGVGAVFILAVSIIWIRKVQAYNAQISKSNRLLEDKNRELHKLSITDKLTGLYNRAKMESELEHEGKRFKRFGVPFSVIVLDVDWFKTINDSYGHGAGDRVLHSIAQRIAQQGREVDIAGRWGGEEFLIICPGTDVHGAYILAENIREAIGTHDFGIHKVTISAGVAMSTDKDQGVEQVVATADRRLYRAKEDKNAVVASGSYETRS